VAEQLLHGADVVAVLEQMRGEAMPQRVAARRLREAGPVHGTLDGALHDLQSRVGIGAQGGGGKQILPTPARTRLRVFARERKRE